MESVFSKSANSSQNQSFSGNLTRGYSCKNPPKEIVPSEFASCSQFDDLEQIRYQFYHQTEFYPTVVIYGSTFVVGVIGNAMVVFAMVCDKKARSVTNSFLVSLALADLLFLLFCVPYELSAKLQQFWFGGDEICKMSAFIEMLTGLASILNLTAVSVERYIVIVHPMKSRSWCTMGSTKKILASLWIVAVCLAIPIRFIYATEKSLYLNSNDYVVVMMCADNSVGRRERLIFACYQMVIMFLLPTLVIFFCYIKVIHVLWLSTKELAKLTAPAGDQDDESRQRLTHHHRSQMTAAAKDRSVEAREARKQVIKMLLTVIIIFLVAWGPLLIVNILKRIPKTLPMNNAVWLMIILLKLLPYLQSATNPIIYAFMSKNFRRSMRTVCRSYCHCDPAHCVSGYKQAQEFDMETKSINGTMHTAMSTTRYSPQMTRSSPRLSKTITMDVH